MASLDLPRGRPRRFHHRAAGGLLLEAGPPRGEDHPAGQAVARRALPCPRSTRSGMRRPGGSRGCSPGTGRSRAGSSRPSSLRGRIRRCPGSLRAPVRGKSSDRIPFRRPSSPSSTTTSPCFPGRWPTKRGSPGSSSRRQRRPSRRRSRIHPGSGSQKKNWPFERFLELSRGLSERGEKVAWVLGPAEDGLAGPFRPGAVAFAVDHRARGAAVALPAVRRKRLRDHAPVRGDRLPDRCVVR